MANKTYDTSEAEVLMVDFRSTEVPDALDKHEFDKRTEAVGSLLSDLRGLDGTAGFIITVDKEVDSGIPYIKVRIPNHPALGTVKIKPDLESPGEFWIQNLQRTQEEPQTIVLRFNQITGVLEGEDTDSFHSPVPGQAQKKRSAIAVLMESALAALSD